jgi:hypothetical protein
MSFDKPETTPYNSLSMRYDLCLPWYWEYDDVFVGMVERACIEEGISFWQIKPDNLLESITALYKGVTTFKTLLHRGQGEAIFDPIPRWAREFGVRRINPAEVSAWSEDKATMHLELINAGLHTPYTILLAPFLEQPVIPQIDFTPLGENFVIKPSNGGGGEGVIIGANSMERPHGFASFTPMARPTHAGGIRKHTSTPMSRRRMSLSIALAGCGKLRSASHPSANWIGFQQRSLSLTNSSSWIMSTMRSTPAFKVRQWMAYQMRSWKASPGNW